MLSKSKGFKIFVYGIIFNLLESFYFGRGTERGFNLKPESIGEFICDDIAIVMIVAGAYLMWHEIRRGMNRWEC